MARVIALVEGKTEREFGKQILAPHLGYLGVEFHPRVIGEYGHKGGVGPWERAKRELVALIRNEPTITVTMMFDLYGLPQGWPGRAEATAKGLKHAAAVAFVEGKIGDAVRAEIGDHEPRFVPYLSLHEFEALLFSDTGTLAGVTAGPGDAEAFQAVLDECGECERINDNPDTAPSKRIIRIAPAYAKVANGIEAARLIGLPTIRSRCPHFASWLGRLEQLGRPG